MNKCSKCGKEFEGNYCPHCGTGAGQAPRKITFGRVLLWIFFAPVMAIIAIWQSKWLRTPWKVVLTVLVVLILVGNRLPRTRKAAAAQEPAPAEPPATVSATAAATSRPRATATPKPTEDPTPKEYRNALASAQLYVNLMHMSKARLHDQLTSPYGDQFSEEAAQYALEHVKADWKQNALQMAETYSSTMHMSKARIYDQLTSEYGEQFTAEEAQYAIDTIKADWKANALATARNYRDNLHMSAAAIQQQLTSPYGEKFTAEEAQWAMDHLDD